MATVLEIAEQAQVPAEQVLRVLGGEPVSETTAKRVREAIVALDARRPASSPSAALAERSPSAGDGVATPPIPDVLGRQVVGEVGSLVYEAVRVEVRPVAERVGAIDALFHDVLSGLQRMAAEVAAERRDRVDDLALQVELIRASWTSVDRRLGRLERMLERQANGAVAPEPRAIRPPDPQRRNGTRFGRRPDGDVGERGPDARSGRPGVQPSGD